MTDFFNDFFSGAAVRARGWIFLAGLCAVLVACVAETVFAFCFDGYGVRKRARYFIVSGAAIAAQFIPYADGKTVQYVFAAVFFALVLSLPVLGVPVKKSGVTDRQRELVRFIDGRIKRAGESGEKPVSESGEEVRGGTSLRRAAAVDEKVEILKTSGTRRQGAGQTCDLDFAHIRSVVSRLDYFSLSAADKRTVNDLNFSLAEAERGNISDAVKEKINDGLGALLKIMSKYGA